MHLIIGVGNPLRSDDGVGPHIVRHLEAMSLPGVHTRITQQLHVELLEDLLQYDQIIIVDASSNGKALEMYQVNGNLGAGITSSHHLSAPLLASLAQTIYNKKLNLHVCALKGECFDVGTMITSQVLKRADEAVALIVNQLKEQCHA